MKKILLLTVFSLIAIQAFAQWNEISWDTITFEKPYAYLEIDTSSQNLWQIGKPNKIFFDSAFSPTNAIVTDTIHNYPVNNHSYFDLKIGNFNIDWYPTDISIEIIHKYDTDTLKDGGYITVSYDSGMTWMNVIDDTIYEGQAPNPGNPNLYGFNDVLYNGEHGFSGHSNGWTTTVISWIYPIIKTNNGNIEGDTMILRFNFISDSIDTNKEGWMIDNIRLFSANTNDKLSEVNELNFNFFPNPMNNKTIVKIDEYREIELGIFDVQGRELMKYFYHNNEAVIIDKEDLKPGIYLVKIKTDNGLFGVRKLIVR